MFLSVDFQLIRFDWEKIPLKYSVLGCPVNPVNDKSGITIENHLSFANGCVFMIYIHQISYIHINIPESLKAKRAQELLDNP